MLTLVAAVLVYDLADDSVPDNTEGLGLRSSRSLSRNERSWTRLEKDMVGVQWLVEEVRGPDEFFFENRKRNRGQWRCQTGQEVGSLLLNTSCSESDGTKDLPTRKM